MAETAEGYVTLLGPAELEACAGSVDALFGYLRTRSAELGLALG